MKWVLATLFLIQMAYAYVPPTRMILQRTVENAGDGTYQIEKEVHFSNPDIPTFRGIWQVENERAMKLTVIPVGVQPAPKLTILYTGVQKEILYGAKKETTRVPTENVERLFHFPSNTLDKIISVATAATIETTTYK